MAIFTDEPENQGGWHGAQLKQAFVSHGVEAIFVSLQNCVIDLSGSKPCIQIPGFEESPKAAFVRGIAGGTLQQVIARLNVLHMLKMLGVSIYNDGRAIERTVDKVMTSFLLHQAGVATPQTWLCESRHYAHHIIEKNEQLVIKPLFGSQGHGVRLVNLNKLPLPMDAFVDGVFYLQSFIQSTHDYRIFVIHGKVVASMKRTGTNWVNNVAAGGHCEAVQPNKRMMELALQAALALEIDYCGVDIIQAASGEYYVLEVNSIPAWKGLQSVTDVNIAQLLVDDFLRKVQHA